LASCSLSKNVKIKGYKTTVLHVVLYGCEVFHIMGKTKFRMSENRVLRRIFDAKKEEGTGG
jgi:hypothetical protein